MSSEPPPPQPPPAGWYPHPSVPDAQGYWDGARWTEQVAPKATAPAGLTASADPAEAARAAGTGCGTSIATIVVAVAVVLVVAFAFAIFDGDDDADPSGANSESTAKMMCEQMIGDRLKSPASAEYSQVEAQQTGTRWEVVGLVDAENSFGAQLRQAFRCDGLRHVGGDKWRADEVRLLDYAPGVTGPGTLRKR